MTTTVASCPSWCVQAHEDGAEPSRDHWSDAVVTVDVEDFLELPASGRARLELVLRRLDETPDAPGPVRVWVSVERDLGPAGAEALAAGLLRAAALARAAGR